MEAPPAVFAPYPAPRERAGVRVAPRVAAVIPVLNEQGAIGPTVRAIPRDVVDRIFVVDGGSRDGTVAEAEAAGATVLNESRRGYGRACATGAERAIAEGAQVILFMDGDGADAVEESARLAGPVLNGTADFVIGSRMRGVREKGSLGPHQVFAGWLIGGAVGLLTGTRYTDMGAFRAIGADALARLGMREMTYGWNLEMQMRAAYAGLRIREIPVPYRRRVAGRSKVAGNLRGSIKAGWRITATLLRVARMQNETARRVD
ncbi:MAG: glycosyltransferase family 2 protein [Proteobacteria bacterium]|nr:glycosyltransferase family 2 protein [Pseudomonadota bacterium]